MLAKMRDTLNRNIKYLVNIFTAVISILLSILSFILMFFSWEDMGITNKVIRFLIISIILIVAVLITSICFACNRENTIWKNGTGSITLIYADLLKLSFSKRRSRQKPKIAVIPVNTGFDTTVGKGIVSQESIQGKWITKMQEEGFSQSDLDELINKEIQRQKLEPLYQITRNSDNQKCLVYPQGSVLALSGIHGTTFFLLALSDFDNNNVAQCSKDDIVRAIQSLITFYNKVGQGAPLYVPLLGTGLSRVGLSHEESLRILSSLLNLYSDQIHGSINIVVYSKDKDKVSIQNI